MTTTTATETGTSNEARARQEALFTRLRALPSLVVAYSGGVDSAYLAWAATETIGDRAVCVTADSPSYPERHRAMAVETAARFGFRHEIIRTAELENPAYRANHTDRC